MSWQSLGFWLTALISVATAVMVVVHKNPVRAALYLVLNFVCLAVLYLLLNAQLLAALQVLVYAGAIMVLFLFVIMLLNLGGEQSLQDPLAGQKSMAIVLGLVMFGGLFVAIRYAASQPQRTLAPPQTGDQVTEIGRLLMTTYVYPFELTSVLLLVGITGAVLLAKRKKSEELPRGGQ